MHRHLRPTRGFGPWGYALSPVAAALLYCYLGGFDLRFWIMGRWEALFGWMALVHFTVYLVPYNSSLWNPTCGPLVLIYILPAMFLTPRRFPRWFWSLVVVWLFVNPGLCWYLAHRFPAMVSGARSTSHAWNILHIPQLLFFLWISWMVTRSTRTTIAHAAPLLAAYWFFFVTTSRAARSESISIAVASAWHLANAACLLGPALLARRRATRDTHLCPTCGYDQRGLTSAACPECGATFQRQDVPPYPKVTPPNASAPAPS
jgi:hypothetical protein